MGGLVQPPNLHIHRDQTTLGQADGDFISCDFRFPAHGAAFIDDGFHHVRAENAGALGDDHLAVWFFVELDADFGEPVGAAFCPAVLKIVETEDFAFFQGESHDLSVKF